MKNRYLALSFFLVCDFIAALISIILALVVVGKDANSFNSNALNFSFIVWPAALLLFFYIFKIYNILWRYSSVGEFIRIIFGAAAALALLFVIQMAVADSCFALSVYVITFFFTNAIIFIQRIFFKKIAKERC